MSNVKKSFLSATTPFITEMVQVPTADLAKQKISLAIKDGATAIGLQLDVLEREFRTEKVLTEIIATAKDVPVYLTNYRKNLNQGDSDEQLLQELLLGLKCGATLIDVMGDAFCISPEELTTDQTAIKKQMEYIDQVHKLGGEVLISSHVYQFRSAERVLEMALEQQRRGADVVKIVTCATTQEQEWENLRICTLLKQNLKVPFLFLSSGTFNQLHRRIGPALGVNMWLCFREYDKFTYVGPPLLSEVVKLKEGLKL